MSRHHNRFERDYRSGWDRRERCVAINNGINSTNNCSSINSNNRPGLLPLPVIPSLLPTPAAIASTTASNDLGANRMVSSSTTAAAKVGCVFTLLSQEWMK
ncbi:UNVERIFIED_CONTAM: hypothetical protein FKN15_056602 [Acipenser sinensis]